MQAEFYYHREKKNMLISSEVENPNVSLHFHSSLEVYLVVEGEVEVWVNDCRRVLKAGELSVAFSYDAHRYRSKGAARAVYLAVSTDLCGDFLAELGNRRPGDPFITDPQIFQQLRGYCDAIRTETNFLKKKGNLYLLLGGLQEVLLLEERQGQQDTDLSTRILFYINEHFKGDCTPARIAAELGYHPAYLSRFFKDRFHVSMNQYTTMLRLREAVTLMKEPKNSIVYCAYESGFSSVRTFYRVFAEEFKCSPKAYRND